MDNSEVDLLQMMKITWGKKKQILFYTVLIVMGAVLFSYIQPRYYETHMVAFVLPSEGNGSKPQKSLPLEYYAQFSRSPETLNAVLESLPREVKFEDNMSPLDYLMSMLRVETKIIMPIPALTSSALKFTFYVRHTDPLSAYHILKTWREVLDNNFAKFENGVILSKYPEAEKQLKLSNVKLSKAKWDEARKRLVDFKENNGFEAKLLELSSIRNLIVSAYTDIRNLEQRMDSDKILISIFEELFMINEEYLSVKDKLSEYRRLLEQQPQMLSSTGEQKQIRGSNSRNSEKNGVLNPVYTRLQNEILTHEVNFKALLSQKSRLEQKIRNLESGVNSESQIDESPEFNQNRYLIKNLKNKIKQYESRIGSLESQISKQVLDHKTLTREEKTLAILFTSNFTNFKEFEVKSFKVQNSRGLEFNNSALEPVIFLGTPMRRIIFLAFGSGLIFTILITLIKANFGNQEANKHDVKPTDT